MVFDKIKKSVPCGGVWIMYSCEGSDPYFKRFVSNKTIVPAISLVSNDAIILLVHSLDEDNIKDFAGKKVVYDGKKPLHKEINEILMSMGMPRNIYLNYSDNMDAVTDVLGHGIYKFLHDNIAALYRKNNRPIEFNSADTIIYRLLEQKTEEDIKYMSICANRALEIIKSVFRKIKPGMTEKHIFSLFHEVFKNKPAYFKTYGIVNEEFAWEENVCPIVLVGPNLAKGGHSSPSDEVLQPGHTVYCDFGVTIYLDDNRKYASDLQRMGYVLKPNEKTAPQQVKDVFDTLVTAISLGIKNCTPEKRGYEIDSVVRNYILDKGYPDYNHSTGHPVGQTAHSPGVSLAPKNSKRSHMQLQENGVYTIEPRIQINNGGSIEEMVLVTKDGGKTLCQPQQELFLI